MATKTTKVTSVDAKGLVASFSDPTQELRSLAKAIGAKNGTNASEAVRASVRATAADLGLVFTAG